MKNRSLLHSLIIEFSTIILIASCTKDATHTSQALPPPPAKVVNLVADHWQQQGAEQVYLAVFPGIMGNRSAKVYLETGDQEILISNGSVDFMGSKVWSVAYNSDLMVYCQNYFKQVAPNGYLNIKVAFE